MYISLKWALLNFQVYINMSNTSIAIILYVDVNSHYSINSSFKKFI